MKEKRTLTIVEVDGQIDGTIVGLLIDRGAQRPWSVDEIARQVGSDPTDSLKRLYGAGLIHRLEGFVWATRAAVMAGEICQ